MLAKGAISLARVGIAGVSLRRPSRHVRPSERSYRMSARAEASKVTKTDAEWKSSLTEMEYHVLRNKGTERPSACHPIIYLMRRTVTVANTKRLLTKRRSVAKRA